MKKERVSWIDIARGIGILFVLYGHGLSADSYRHIIYAFHMPLFFFLSGIVTPAANQPFWEFFKKSVRGILIPYLLFAFLSYAIWIADKGLSHLFSPEAMKQLIGIAYGNGNNHFLGFNVVLWFLPCLFITRIIFSVIARISRNTRVIAAFLLVFSGVGYVSSAYFSGYKLPFGLETALTAVVFYGVGYVWVQHFDHMKEFCKRYSRELFVISTILCIVIAQVSFSLYGLQIDMRMNRLNNYFLFYTGAFSGILSIVTVSLIINTNRVLEYIGKHSLILFVWHLLAFSYISDFLHIFISWRTINTLRNVYLSPIYTAVSVVGILTINGVVYYMKQKSRHALAYVRRQ